MYLRRYVGTDIMAAGLLEMPMLQVVAEVEASGGDTMEMGGVVSRGVMSGGCSSLASRCVRRPWTWRRCASLALREHTCAYEE